MRLRRKSVVNVNELEKAAYVLCGKVHVASCNWQVGYHSDGETVTWENEIRRSVNQFLAGVIVEGDK